MSGQPPELPPEDGPSITAHVTATGATADYLRQLAAVTGQSPEVPYGKAPITGEALAFGRMAP
ncbi:hypothetical protein ACH4GK_42360 [Streptomyces rimosus]|uniref:hypothetical protein n=1 Tax=Streptomyces rimosus TaxID=1927 RepID=UPI0004C8AA2D|nr:hypothetical protein [Streptomyces rimosus]